MPRSASRHLLSAVALCSSVLAVPGSVARAHGPAPAALGVLDWDGTQVNVVRLNVGLARRIEDDRFRFVCPALWGDARGAPAAALRSGEVVLAAGAGLFLIGEDGVPRPHPDANARGAVVDLVQARDELYALRVVAGQSELLTIDAEHARTLWSDAAVYFSIAADAQRFLLLRTIGPSLAWQWLDHAGAPQTAGELPLPGPVEYAFARLSREQPYALLLEAGRPELGRIADGGWVSIAKGAGSIAGPQALGDVALVAVDGELVQLEEAVTTPLAEGPYVSCLDQFGELAYACTRDGIARLSPRGVEEPLFDLSQLAPPDLSLAADLAQRMDCDYQWQDLRFDLLALGVQVSLEPEPEPDAGAAVDAAAPEDAGAAAAPDGGAPKRANGCSAQSSAVKADPSPITAVPFLLLLLVLLRRTRPSSRLV
jgi:hypothetical protein